MTVADHIRAEEKLSQSLEEYAGEWVAVYRHDVVAHAEDYEDLLEQIESIEVEAVFQVPAEAGLACYF